MSAPHCFVDGWLDVTGVCEDEGWHLASAEHTLMDLGLTRRDAETFAALAFHFAAVIRDAGPPELIPEQIKRLSRR
jgi:hypothetical protein